jgi:carboxyl-terminal processing protease
VDANPNFKLLDENARWLSNQQDDNDIPLSFTAYSERLDRLEKETDKFETLSDYKNDLNFEILPWEKALVKTDSALGDKREAWIKNLKKDIYVAEAVNVLKDLRMHNITNNNQPKLSIKD